MCDIRIENTRHLFHWFGDVRVWVETSDRYASSVTPRCSRNPSLPEAAWRRSTTSSRRPHRQLHVSIDFCDANWRILQKTFRTVNGHDFHEDNLCQTALEQPHMKQRRPLKVTDNMCCTSGSVGCSLTLKKLHIHGGSWRKNPAKYGTSLHCPAPRLPMMPRLTHTVECILVHRRCCTKTCATVTQLISAGCPTKSSISMKVSWKSFYWWRHEFINSLVTLWTKTKLKFEPRMRDQSPGHKRSGHAKHVRRKSSRIRMFSLSTWREDLSEKQGMQ